jgi:hypothetical protein
MRFVPRYSCMQDSHSAASSYNAAVPQPTSGVHPRCRVAHATRLWSFQSQSFAPAVISLIKSLSIEKQPSRSVIACGRYGPRENIDYSDAQFRRGESKFGPFGVSCQARDRRDDVGWARAGLKVVPNSHFSASPLLRSYSSVRTSKSKALSATTRSRATDT